jgi:hypothetical protein
MTAGVCVRRQAGPIAIRPAARGERAALAPSVRETARPGVALVASGRSVELAIANGEIMSKTPIFGLGTPNTRRRRKLKISQS